MTVVIRALHLEGIHLEGRGDPGREGDYLASYDPDGMDGYGLAGWTDDPAEAMRFDDPGQAMALWRTTSTVRPLRPDGKPNRPLSAYTIEIVPSPEESP